MQLACPDDVLVASALSSAAWILQWAYSGARDPRPGVDAIVAGIRSLVADADALAAKREAEKAEQGEAADGSAEASGAGAAGAGAANAAGTDPDAGEIAPLEAAAATAPPDADATPASADASARAHN